MKQFVSSATIAILLLSGLPGTAYSQNSAATVANEKLSLTLPVKDGSVRFAIIGDTGSGTKQQQQTADTLLRYREVFPFEFVLMLGDNLYGGETPKDYDKKFEGVYKNLLHTKVKFYATLGNHDTSNQRFYEHFNMNGKEYYNFKEGNVSFYSLNSNYMDQRQLKWLTDELSKGQVRVENRLLPPPALFER